MTTQLLDEVAKKYEWSDWQDVKLNARPYTQTQIIEEAMKEYARIKCLEAIKNTRHKSVDIILNNADRYINEDSFASITRDIQNIPNQDVMPEL